MVSAAPVRLDGTAVAITGGARGIGLATAKAFAARGSRVFIGDLDGDLAAAAAADFGGHGTGLDVRSRESFRTFLDAVDAAGAPLTVLVNNAGIMPAGRFIEEDDATTDAILDVNTKGVLIGTKLVLPGMLERGHGHIVNVSSYLGKMPAAGLATYCASKHAVVGFSEALRDELAGSGVTVSVVLPTVDPEDIANAVVATCTHRRPLLAVPAWIRAYEATAAAMPDRLVAAVRGRLTRERVLQSLDTGARSAYEERVREANRQL
jgi:NAD(P)-dependent dehydrogenase (short-subunit alcohol dehydrogenase family)